MWDRICFCNTQRYLIKALLLATSKKHTCFSPVSRYHLAVYESSALRADKTLFWSYIIHCFFLSFVFIRETYFSVDLLRVYLKTCRNSCQVRQIVMCGEIYKRQ